MSENLAIDSVIRAGPWAQSRLGLARRAVFALDSHLRQRHGIIEFTARPDCILRIAPAIASHDLALSDGTRIRRGDPLLDLHLWNEHVPTIPPEGLTLRWAAASARCARASLRALAAATRDRTVPDFVALRGRMRFGGHLLDARFAGCGFDTIAEPEPPSLRARLHDLGENCLLGLLLWAFNPAGLGHAHLIRARRHVWMSRARLLARHPAQRH